MVQDEAHASYAAPFSEAEHWLDLTEPADVVQRKFTALHMAHAGSARVKLNDKAASVEQLEVEWQASSAAPGAIIEQHETTCLIQTADGQVRLTLKTL